MSSLPLLAVAGASFSLSGFDLCRKLLGRHLAPLPMVVLLATGSIPLFAGLVGMYGVPAVPPDYVPVALTSVLLNLGAHLAFLEAVRLSPLSLTVPLLSLTPVFAALAGLLVLGERPNSAGVAGILLVVIGTYFLQRSSYGESACAPSPAIDRLVREPGAWLMTGAALLWSVSLPLDKLALRLLDPNQATGPGPGSVFHGLVLTTGIALGAVLVLSVRGRLHDLKAVRRSWGVFWLALLTSTLALCLQLVAIQSVLVSLMETAKRGVGNVAAVVLGRSVFREPLTLYKIGAALLLSVGVALLLL